MWEFRVLALDPLLLEDRLNELGAASWGLFSVDTVIQNGAIVTVRVLMRERSNRTTSGD